MSVGSAWVRRSACALIAFGALVLATAAPAGDPPAEPFRWIRAPKTPEEAAALVVAEAARRKCDSVVFVFDVLSFDPPPGRHEFSSNGNLRYDTAAWFAALDGAAARGTPVWAATTRSRQAVPVEGAWAAGIQAELNEPWWDDQGFHAFAPAERWARRLAGPVPGGRPAVVLLASEMPPEARPPRAARPEMSADETRWRNKLLARGEGFDAERVGDAMDAMNGVFFAIAPEARFGDFLPVGDTPQYPWATRPAALLHDGARAPAVTGGVTPGGPRGTGPGGRRRGGGGRDGAAPVPGGRGVGASADPEDAPDDVRDPGGRFVATTPRFQRGPEFNTDCPSGYGWWPYGRVAARTGGACILYPFPPRPWADDCPRYDPLMDALAPETCSQGELTTRLCRDPIVAVLARAQRIVFEATPWDDAGGRGGAAAAASDPGEVHGDASSWFGLEMRGPLVPAARWISRDMARDELGRERSLEQWMRYGAELRRTVARYEQAGRVLDDAAADLAAGKLAGASRRSQANLRLARFWNSMSAFHLHALSIYLTGLDRRMPAEPPREILITYLPAVRLSDCLDAFDDRTISWDEEKAYGWTAPFREKGGQGNFLVVPLDDPNYRAKRDLECVLLRLDDRLLDDALRVVGAAEDVMRHEGRSAWGWVTYYSELHTFIWEPVPDRTGPTPQGPRSKKQKAAKTPKDADPPPPPPTTPGSGPGGGASTGK